MPAEPDWLGRERIIEPGQATGAAAAFFELRPLSLGEILDRIFALYRSRFWLFAGISVAAAAFHVLVQGMSLSAAHGVVTGLPLRPADPHQPLAIHRLVAAELGTWVAGLLFFLVVAITQAATSFALSEVYMNRPASAGDALRTVLPRWSRWIGIALWQAWSLAWLPVALVLPGVVLAGIGTRSQNLTLGSVGVVLAVLGALGGFPAGVVMYLRNTLAIPAALVEGLTIRPAMRRSKALAAGTKGRIFVVLLIAGALLWIVGVLELPAALLVMLAPRQEHHVLRAVTMLISFVGQTVVQPVALIGLTLVYFDQRVRKEALDLELLLTAGRGGVPQPGGTTMPPGRMPEELPPLA